MKNSVLKLLLISSSLFSISSNNFAHSTNLSQSVQLKNLFRNINAGTKNHPGTIKQSFNFKNMSGLGNLTPRYSIKANARTASSAFNFANMFTSSHVRRAAAHTSPVTNTKSISPAARFANIFASPNVGTRVSPVTNTKSTSPTARFANMFASLNVGTLASPVANTKSTSPATSVANMFASLNVGTRASPVTNTKSTSPATSVANILASLNVGTRTSPVANTKSTSPTARFANIFASLNVGTRTSPVANTKSTSPTASVANIFASPNVGTRASPVANTKSTSPATSVASMLASLNVGTRASPVANTKSTSPATSVANIFASLSPSTEEVRRTEANLVAARQAAAQRAERTRRTNEQDAAQQAERTRLAYEDAAQRTERTRLAYEDAAQRTEQTRLTNEQAAAQRAERTRRANEQAAAQQAERTRHANEQAARRAAAQQEQMRLANEQAARQAAIQQAERLLANERATAERTRLANEQAAQQIAFNTQYDSTFTEFPLNAEKKRVFYRALRVNFDGMPWADVMNVLTPLLKKSLPLDYDEWPDFVANPAANFDAFIHNVVTPAINAVRGQINIQAAVENYVEDLLKRKEQTLKRNLRQKINRYKNLNNEYINEQMTDHGHKIPLIGLSNNVLQSWHGLLGNILMDLDDEASNNPTLRKTINFSDLCNDPFLTFLRSPEAKLTSFKQNYNVNHAIEINNFKTRVLNLIPAQDRILEEEFNQSFVNDPHGFSLDDDTDLNRETVIRLQRLYDYIRENQNELAAARVIYAFGTENSNGCVDRKRDRITELERQYVYVAGNQAAGRDSDTIIGLNLSKLFMDDRMDKLRQTINALYDEGESRTYAWSRSHRALYTRFGIPGDYDITPSPIAHREGIDPVEFIEKYFKGGAIGGVQSARVHNIEAFTVDKMVTLVLNDIKKEMGGSFDNDTLDYMINSNLALRRAYASFQEHEGDASFENDYFKDATLDQRLAIKKEAIVEVLKTYNYVYTRNDRDEWE